MFNRFPVTSIQFVWLILLDDQFKTSTMSSRVGPQRQHWGPIDGDYGVVSIYIIDTVLQYSEYEGDVCMDFEAYFKVHSLVSVHPKSIILGQMTNLNMIF